jgi:hypothetical protein
MIYCYITKNENLSTEEVFKIKKKNSLVNRPQNILFDEAIVAAQNISIFGDKDLFVVEITLEAERELLNERVIEILKTSEHTFIIWGDKTLEEIFKNLNQKYETLKVLEVNGFPAALVTALQKRDKKNSWKLYLDELGKSNVMQISGSIGFAYKTLLSYFNDTKNNSELSGVKDYSWKQARENGKIRNRDEVVDTYFNFVKMMNSHRLEGKNTESAVEAWILK